MSKMKSLALVLALIVSALPVGQASAAIPVVVYGGPDDGLSLRLLDAIRQALTASPRFALTSKGEANTLAISLKTNVTPLDRGARRLMSYTVQFVLLPARVLGTNEGICLQDEPADCADQVLKSAQVNWAVNQP